MQQEKHKIMWIIRITKPWRISHSTPHATGKASSIPNLQKKRGDTSSRAMTRETSEKGLKKTPGRL
jgi:hypothetical protein